MTKSTAVIIGAGPAGLATSYFLTRRGIDHVVLDKAPYVASAWRDARWDSFTLVTPNWAFQLPGAAYEGNEPDGYMPRDEVVARVEEYAGSFGSPLELGVKVTAVEGGSNGSRFRVRAEGAEYPTDNVVIAAGLFQGARRPAFADSIASRVTQVHAGAYRNPSQLPPGAVLVVGSAQSGCQIAEELAESGRRVYLALSSAGRVPRRYRGRDAFR